MCSDTLVLRLLVFVFIYLDKRGRGSSVIDFDLKSRAKFDSGAIEFRCNLEYLVLERIFYFLRGILAAHIELANFLSIIFCLTNSFHFFIIAVARKVNIHRNWTAPARSMFLTYCS